MPLLADLDIPLFIGILISVLLLNYFLFRRLLFSLVDPIWFLVIVNTTVTLALVIYDRAMNDEFFSWTVFYVVVAHIMFIAAARLTRVVLTRGLTPSYLQAPHVNTVDPRASAWILKTCTLLLFLLAVYYVGTGLPALSSDPELARVMLKKGGGGVMARLLNVFAYLSLTLWFYCRLRGVRLGFIWSCLGILLPLFLLLFVGAKASLLLVYISFFYVSYYVAYETNREFKFPAKYFFISAGVVLCVSFVLLFARAGEAGASDSSLEFAGIQLLGRIIFSGVGAAHYFSTDIPALAQLGTWDYFYQYVLLPLFAPLRIFDYEPTVGTILALSMTGDDTFGPNPSMYVEGMIYFGPFFGVLYCAVLGVIFSIFRYLPLRFTRSPAFFRVVMFSFGNMLIMSMTYDMILFVGDLINFIFFAAITLFVFVLLRASLRLAPRVQN